jgi:hypothetical protein
MLVLFCGTLLRPNLNGTTAGNLLIPAMTRQLKKAPRKGDAFFNGSEACWLFELVL